MNRYRFNELAAVDLLEKAILIIATILITYFLARAAKWAFAKLVDNVGFFRRHNTESGETIGHALGRLVSLLIWLVGLIVVLQILDLGEAMLPVQGLLEGIVDYIPNIIGAAVILFIGMVIAKIVRDITVTALETVDFDRWLNRSGGETLTGNPRISRTVGTIFYALIVIFFAIMALDVLDIRAVSQPASAMLNLILNSIPLIIGAALLIGIGYLIGKFVAQLLQEILPGLGVDRAIGSTDLLPGSVTISSIIAKVAQIAIVLFFAIAATRLLNFPELTLILGEILELGGQVIFGAVVILFGFLLARMLARMIGGSEETGLAALVVKWATIFVFTFMGLQFTGIGEDIIRIFFGALVIGAAVAGALAFGIGGREWAGRKLEQMDEKVKEQAQKPASSRRSSSSGSYSGVSGSPEPGTDNDNLPPLQQP